MREFTFSIDYGEGADPIADAFIEHPSLTARSLYGCVTAEQFWRVERVVGPTAGLDTIERCRLDESSCSESVTERNCVATQYHDVLERGDDERVFYTHMEDIDGGESVQTLAGRYLPTGSLCHTRRRGARQEWCIVMRSDEKVGLLYDALSATLRSDLSFHVGHLKDADSWCHDGLGSVALPPDQRAAVQAAAEHGYYRTPRAVTLDELASRLDIPRSTLSYRLQRAEEQLVDEYLDDS